MKRWFIERFHSICCNLFSSRADVELLLGIYWEKIDKIRIRIREVRLILDDKNPEKNNFSFTNHSNASLSQGMIICQMTHSVLFVRCLPDFPRTVFANHVSVRE